MSTVKKSYTRGCNRPLPSSWNPQFQHEVKCATFLVKMSFICMRIKNHFRIKGWASLRNKRFRAVSRVKERAKMALVSFLAQPKPRISFLGLSLLQNSTETLATQAKAEHLTSFCYRSPRKLENGLLISGLLIYLFVKKAFDFVHLANEITCDKKLFEMCDWGQQNQWLKWGKSPPLLSQATSFPVLIWLI